MGITEVLDEPHLRLVNKPLARERGGKSCSYDLSEAILTLRLAIYVYTPWYQYVYNHTHIAARGNRVPARPSSQHKR